MSTGAFVLMVAVQLTVTLITGFFFWKVLKTPPKAEPDSFADNDNDPR
jgi:hypothetical protein